MRPLVALLFVGLAMNSAQARDFQCALKKDPDQTILRGTFSKSGHKLLSLTIVEEERALFFKDRSLTRKLDNEPTYEFGYEISRRHARTEEDNSFWDYVFGDAIDAKDYDRSLGKGHAIYGLEEDTELATYKFYFETQVDAHDLDSFKARMSVWFDGYVDKWKTTRKDREHLRDQLICE